MKIILTTHGGLGNQLFQILYGRLLAMSMQCELYELHNSNYARMAYREAVPFLSPIPKKKFEVTVSKCRLPKIVSRIKGLEVGYIRVWNTFYCDAYFQNEKYFNGFDSRLIHACLEQLREELRIDTKKSEDQLLHLRLGDFFKSRNEALAHVKHRLENCSKNTKVISSDNSIILDEDIIKLLEDKKCEFIDTSDMRGVEILRLMSRFKEIDANESTLTFWASVFGSQVSLKSKQLQDLVSFFRSL